MNVQTILKRGLAGASLLLLATAFSGCADIKQYSINSYQGILPIEDYQYVYNSPVVAPAPEPMAGMEQP